MRWIRCAVMAGVVLFVGCGNDMKLEKIDVGDVSIETATLGNTPNVHKIGDVYFAGQPGKEDLKGCYPTDR